MFLLHLYGIRGGSRCRDDVLPPGYLILVRLLHTHTSIQYFAPSPPLRRRSWMALLNEGTIKGEARVVGGDFIFL